MIKQRQIHLTKFIYFPIQALEVSAPRVRSAVGVAILMPWSINTVIFSGVAYLIRDWRMLQLVMSLLGLLHIPGLWWVCVSRVCVCVGLSIYVCISSILHVMLCL